MPASTDPDKRANQLRNLRADAATQHGAYSESKLAPLRERFIAELSERFGEVATADEIELAADRRARVKAISDWLDRRGLLADKRTGRPRAVVQLADRLQTAYERQLADLRRRGGGRREHGPLLQIELTPAEKLGLLSDDPKVSADMCHRILSRLRDEPRTLVESEEPGLRLDLRKLTDDELDTLEDIVGDAE